MKKIYFLTVFIKTLCCSAQTWTSIGPNGGYFKDFTIHPSNPQIVFAGSDDSGGIWKSTDGGQNWTHVSALFPNFTGWKIVFDKTNPNKIYACDMYGRYGLIKSIDGGNTWQLKNNGLNTRYDKMVTGIVHAHNKPDTLLVSTGYEPSGIPPRPGNGVFKSFNGGNTWFPAGLQGTTTPCIASNGPGGAILVGTIGSGLKVTANLGQTWINHPQIPATANILEIETDSNIVMVSALTNGIYLSTDYGNNFTNIGMLTEVNFDINIFKKTPTIELFSSAFSGLKKYSSSTGNWTAVNHPELNTQLAMGIGSRGNTVYLSNFSNANILKSTDGGISWNFISNSPKATEVGGLYIDPSNPNHIITSVLGTYNLNGLLGKECILETVNGGTSWIRKGPVAHGRGLAKDPNNPTTFYLGTYANGLYKTVDAFTTFTNVRSGNRVILDVVVNPNNNQEVLISEIDNSNSSIAILKSANGGLTFNVTSTLVATKFDFDPVSPSVVYASTYSGLYKSTDAGSTWNIMTLSNVPLSTVKSYSNHIYTSHLNGTLYKVNGTSTVNITGSWPNNSQINNVIESNGKLIVGINGAEKDTTLNLFGSTYLSVDSGSNWINITGNMPCTHVYAMNGLNINGNDIYVATYGGGVYKSTGLITSIKEKKNLPQINVYPNPVVDFLKIDFENIKSEIIECCVRNCFGKIVLEQAVSKANPEIDISMLCSGFYIVSFATIGIEPKKIIKK
jgi:photosystem II stability/assembly factor-like uncharacterized protein